MLGMRIGILYEVKDKLSGGLNKIKERMKGINDMQKKARLNTREYFGSFRKKIREAMPSLDQFSLKNAQMFDAMKSEVPFLGRLGGLLSNPFVLATAAVAALGVTLGAATMAAGKFHHEFLDIRQLNLDKNQAQLQGYKDLILDTALHTGKSAIEMSKAFYDVQSATGLFGNEVQAIAQQVGDFSTATKADLADSINSTVKAMKTFGFGAGEVTRFLESNAKTVQVGITTFNELAQVQTEFAGAAKAAGQDFDTANKLFAAFTASAKDSQMAATLTKTAFQGLTAKATVEGLQDIGVSLFDASGKMKNLDTVIRELNPIISQMSDEEFLEMRNAIGGPEGLQNLFNQLRSAGDDVIKTLDAFDKSQFNIEDALKNAKGDFVTLKHIVGNQLNVAMIKLGEIFLPMVARAFDAVSQAILWVSDNSRILMGILKGLLAGLLVLKLPAILTFTLWAIKTGLATAATFTLAGALHAVKVAFFSIPIIGWIAAAIAGLVALYQSWDKFRHLVDGTLNVFVEFLPVLKSLGLLIASLFTFNPANISSALGNLKDSWKNFSVGGAFERGVAQSKQRTEAEKKDPNNFDSQIKGFKDNMKVPKLTTDKSDPEDGEAQGLASKNVQHRNVTVNIQNLNGEGGIQIHTQTIEGSEEEVEDHFRNLLIRAVRNSETAL